MRVPGIRFWSSLAGLALVFALAGCGAGEPTGLGSSRSSTSTSTSPAPVVPPDDGVLLGRFGFANGPTDSFSLPVQSLLTAVVDQPDNVSAVFSRPTTTEVYGYLVRTLPGAGFTLTDQDANTTTLTFVGRGWRGSFTGDARACAILLRPYRG